jgi:hypothetical protein
VAGLVTVLPPDAPLLLAAATALAGHGALRRAAPRRPGRRRPARGAGLGALAAPGIRTLVLSQVPIGIAFGSMQVTLPAFAGAEGTQELAGVLLATLSLASVTGGLVYGLAPAHAPARRAARPPGAARAARVRLPAARVVRPVHGRARDPGGRAAVGVLRHPQPARGRRGRPRDETEAVTWPLTALIAGWRSARRWRGGGPRGRAGGRRSAAPSSSRRSDR